MKNFRYGTDKLTIRSVLALTHGRLHGTLSAKARHKVDQSASFVKDMVSNRTAVYGVTTGFGPLHNTVISAKDVNQLQHNLLQSHAVGVGPSLPVAIAKTMMVLKAQALAQGYSGIQLRTLERIIWLTEQDIIPMVPSQGSVGASGDLAPLAHLFLPLIGLGEVCFKGNIIPADVALKACGMPPLTLGPKEGLALINGTQFIAAHCVHALHRMYTILEAADLIGAMSMEGLMGSYKPFDARLHELRPFPGNQFVAQRLWELLHASEMANSHPDGERLQDPYSLRCMPQVHGASRTAWLHLKQLTEIEMNAVTDNPIVLGQHEAVSGGNFHGQPLAIAIDYATVAAAELGNISDRRSYLIIEGRHGLPKLLIPDAGLHSGFMVPQYTAAALVSENKTLCFPASADSIPTSLGQEDHVSMGAIGARKLNKVIDNLEYILAIELLYAAQAMDFRRPLKSSDVLEACHSLIRKEVSFADHDRIFADDINKLRQLISSGRLLDEANQAAEAAGYSLSKTAYDVFGI